MKLHLSSKREFRIPPNDILLVSFMLENKKKTKKKKKGLIDINNNLKKTLAP